MPSDQSYYRLFHRHGTVCLAFRPETVPLFSDELNQFGAAMAERSKGELTYSSLRLGTSWGFGGCLQPTDPTPEGWSCFPISPPEGLLSGKAYDKAKYLIAKNIGATLNLIATTLRSVKFAEHRYLEHVQPVFITAFGQMRTGRGTPWPMAASVSDELMTWLRQLETRNPTAFAELIHQTQLAMHTMWSRLWPDAGMLDPPQHFWVTFDGESFRRLVLNVPGDACDLGAIEEHPDPGEPLQLNEHNVDTPIQAYTLLAGLAKIDELTWQDLGK